MAPLLLPPATAPGRSNYFCLMSGLRSADQGRRMDRRIHDRHLATFQVRLTDLASPEVSASGEGIDISESGIGVYLPLKFAPGSAVELNINDSTLFGVV